MFFALYPFLASLGPKGFITRNNQGWGVRSRDVFSPGEGRDKALLAQEALYPAQCWPPPPRSLHLHWHPSTCVLTKASA